MESALRLSLEQEFNLKAFKHQIDTLSSDEKSKILMEVLQQLMIKNNVIRHLTSPNTGSKQQVFFDVPSLPDLNS